MVTHGKQVHLRQITLTLEKSRLYHRLYKSVTVNEHPEITYQGLAPLFTTYTLNIWSFQSDESHLGFLVV